MAKKISGPSYGLLEPGDLSVTSRRRFLQGGGAGLLMGFVWLRNGKAWAAGEEPSLKVIGGGDNNGGNTFQGFQPGGFIRIAGDGKITFIIPNTEMGQGIYTGESMLIAEELEVGLDQITVIPAPPNEQLYQQPILKSQATGGSTSIRGAWIPLRQAGAAARTMLVAAAAARWGVPAGECTAERAVVKHGPTGRTLGYGELVDDASKQTVPADIVLKDPKDFKLVGKPAKRIDTPSKVNGSALYGIDVRLPGMKIAAVEVCPVVDGKLKDVDTRPARAVPGVVDVVKLDNAVAVIGDHFWAARQGLAALDINWDNGSKENVSTQRIVEDLKTASEVGKPVMGRTVGDVAAGFRNAAKTVEAVYQLPFLAHATMEPINTTVHVRPDACEIWVGTQAPTAVQKAAADLTGLPVEKVIVNNYMIGGGFGRRLIADSIVQAVNIAKQVSYPVKVIWTREQDIKHDLFRPAYYDHIKAGLGADGMPTVFTDRVTGGSVLGSYLPKGLPEGVLDTDAIEGAAETPYDFPATQVDWVRKDPPIKVNWWRGVGPTHNVFVVESFIDEMAQAAGKDPVEYRRALLGKNPRALAVLNLAAEKAGWGEKLPDRTGRGISLHDSFGSYLAVVLETSVSPAGEVKLRRITAAVDCGININPNSVKAQVEGGFVFGLSAALYNGITLANGQVEQNNFNDYRQIRINEIPPFEVHIVASGENPGGLGESGTVSAAPSLGNAIFAATGVRLRTLPFDREELRQKGSDGSVLSMVAPVGLAVAGLASSDGAKTSSDPARPDLSLSSEMV
ncbi:isoquinoline 1-oxidoreductase, beta subunit [Faunimonas pinastri]|uniref:Isoquinoline 1-oxidoreductase, beta subunit n=1 Tax=Faunimonas pinastri TaxID=1855383 RepID=A0A1H9Q1L0_9HYPH|nr:xanthine dehydrogenase family protein molybdopterin-binding subunit [Faunimonas pinastri]SER54314.1 isoquinoline 1-oxidoreductase, beta subunit [Faunimonas pinastri]